MSSSPASDIQGYSFDCDCGDEMRRACEREPFYKEHDGKRYCILHFPGEKDSAKFNQALKWKVDVKDFNFHGVWFGEEVSFTNRYFGEKVNFIKAHFSKAVNFSEATFSDKADFRFATFKAGVKFSYATFRSTVDFRFAHFGDHVSFSYATFNADSDFGFASFTGPSNFARATFKGYVKFAARNQKRAFSEEAQLSLEFSNIEKPDRFSFHTLNLCPNWFINVDTRKFEFINVDWNWRDISAKKEIESISGKDVLSAHRLLAIACRNLAVNAEENHRYDEASKFRYMAMEAQRLESRQDWRSIISWVLGWLYWLASGYSERAGRAFVVLIVVWLVAAALYTQVGFVRWEPRVSSEPEAAAAKSDEVGQPLQRWRPLTYSLQVMTLQKPEPRPATNWAQAVVMLETILGPVQAALLALAIRRKFMR